MIVGADGAIGRRLVAAFEADGKSVWQTTRQPATVSERRLFLDLSGDLNQYFLPFVQINTAILCAAITSIEHCRIEPEKSRHVNVQNTVALAEQLVNSGAFVIFLSTNAVFSGQIPFVKPTDLVDPQSEYGSQKAEAEDKLLKLGDKVAIVRFSKVISSDMQLINGWINDLNAGKVIHPFSDMVMSPIPVTFAVSLLKEIALKQISGIIQVSANQDVTYADLALHICSKLGAHEQLIQPISYQDVGLTLSARNTTLESSRLYELGMAPPDVWKGVDETFELVK